MAEISDIARLVDRLGDRRTELALELEAGGDLTTMVRLTSDIESIAATLNSAFDAMNDAMAEQVRNQFPTELAAAAA